jgi:hypothetical protein
MDLQQSAKPKTADVSEEIRSGLQAPTEAVTLHCEFLFFAKFSSVFSVCSVVN